MAAQRLIILLAILLALSTLLWALAPPLEEPDEDEPDEPMIESPRPEARTIIARIEAGADPATIEARVGDRIELEVASDVVTQIAIRDLGLLRVAAPGTPARFSLRPRAAGTLPITQLADGELRGRIEVR